MGCADPAACCCPPPSAAYGLIVRPNDFASYLLAIGICNLLLYFAFYIIMKVRAKPPGLAVWVAVCPAGRARMGIPAICCLPLTLASPAAPQR